MEMAETHRHGGERQALPVDEHIIEQPPDVQRHVLLRLGRNWENVAWRQDASRSLLVQNELNGVLTDASTS